MELPATVERLPTPAVSEDYYVSRFDIIYIILAVRILTLLTSLLVIFSERHQFFTITESSRFYGMLGMFSKVRKALKETASISQYFYSSRNDWVTILPTAAAWVRPERCRPPAFPPQYSMGILYMRRKHEKRQRLISCSSTFENAVTVHVTNGFSTIT